MRGRSYPARALRVRGAPRLSPQGTYVIDRPCPKPELRDGFHGRRGPAQKAQGDAQQLGPGRQAAPEAGGEAGRGATGGGHLDAEAAPALPEPGHAPGPPLAQLRPWREGPTRESALEPGVRRARRRGQSLGSGAEPGRWLQGQAWEKPRKHGGGG